MRYTLIIIAVFFSISTLFAQEEKKLENIPFADIEKVPVYPGCTGEDNSTLKQ